MAVAFARVVMVVPLLAQDRPVAISMMSDFAFLADGVGAAHEMGITLSKRTIGAFVNWGKFGPLENCRVPIRR